MKREEITRQRRQILEHLYDARLDETRYRRGYIAHRELTDLLGDCAFNLGVLEELGQVERSGNRYRITGHGVIAFEAE